MESKDKTIKAIETGYYQITLVECHEGYRVNYSFLGEDHQSQVLHDYKTADFIFEYRLNEVQGA
jgi:hypothetical protein